MSTRPSAKETAAPAPRARKDLTTRRLAALGEPGDADWAAKLLARLRKTQPIGILGHEHPDGDCAGSAIALCAILRKAGFTARVYFPEPLPPRYGFLKVDDYVRVLRRSEKLETALAFVLDTTGLDRLGDVRPAQLQHAVLLNIDHHVSNLNFGAVNWVCPEAAATGELIWRLAVASEWAAPPVAQEALYAALVTDTGQFAYSNTSARVLRMAAELVDGGVDPEVMWRRLYLDKTPGELELEARARDSFEVWAGGKIAVISLTHEDFVATRTTPEAAQEFPAIPRSLAGCELALFFYEVDQGRATKLSIRSQREINSCALAQHFGGGGHRQAAGCRLPAQLPDAKRLVRPVAEAVVGGGNK